ncbi:MAG: serine/threonine protein kinase [Deltaproteobacteria bacterium]|nr:serine/threonine protein kinase [Deltaproteobacteria bacterium]
MHPELFGSCRVLKVIASGPLTEVYLAEQQPLQRQVAIKALKSSISPSSPFAFTLAREAEILSSLRHDNIPRLLEFVRTDTAMWIAMELCDGFSLREVLDAAKRIEPHAAVAIAVGIARALAHIHDRGIIHCDICSTNVLLSRSGDVMLVDFGSAQAENLPSSPEPVDGQTALGSPAYMSPEQILGEPIDARSDLFSLGILLHEMLAGKRPFDDEDQRTAAHRVRHDEAAALGPELHVPRALSQVAATCLRKLPSDRYGSAAEARAALDEVASNLGAPPRKHAIASLLARARLIDRAPAALDREQPDAPALQPPRASILGATRMLLAMLGLIVGGGALIHFAFRSDIEASAAVGRGPLELNPAQPGYLRVLARPWAHVVIDGQQVETTPFAKPIPLAAGVHHVTLRHPNAPDERRVVRLAAGERVVLDVTMNVRTVSRPDASAPLPPPSSPTP